jgi:hypothetical protein
MTTIAAAAPDHYRADVQRLNDALSDYVFTADDGWQGIDPAAPSPLIDLYASLTSIGYANGWLA